jgi:GTP-binding protein
MALRLLSAEFLRTSTRREEWPAGPMPEFAFVGRSNVGKSSMLNALARRRKLARVSNTPGRTRQLQFFAVTVQTSPAARPRTLRFCDLPGYGYAKVSREERDRWASMIEEYLRERPDLRAVVLIVDGRHPPAQSDREALAFLAGAGRPVLVAATKMDKVPRNGQAAAARRIELELGVPQGSAVPFSAVEGTGADALWSRLLELSREPAARPA